MLLCKGSTSRQGLCYCGKVFQGRMYVTVERYFRVGGIYATGREGSGSKGDSICGCCWGELGLYQKQKRATRRYQSS